MMRSESKAVFVLLLMSGAFLLSVFGGKDLAFAQSNDPAVVQAEQQAFREAIAVVDPVVVQVQTVGGTDRVGELFVGSGPSTGVIVSEDGYVVTSAFNFATKPSSVLVRLGDGRSFAADVIATDHLRKLTLLKIDASGLPTAEPFPKDEMKAGEWSIAVGRTYQVEIPNVSIGIISAVDRVWGKAIQTDAKISPVNYGGPLVAIDGRIQGILVPMSVDDEEVTAGVDIYDSGIGFGIPMSDVMENVERLKAGKDIRQGLMGVQFQAQGFQGRPLVGRVREGSPSEKAGLEKGDVIKSANGVAVSRVADFKQIIGRLYGGDELVLDVERDGKSVELKCQLVEELAPYVTPSLGIIPERLLAGQQKDQEGIVIRAVLERSPAEKAGLKNGDRIVRFDGNDVKSLSTLSSVIRGGAVGQTVELAFVRDEKEATVSVTLEKQSASVPAKLSAMVVSSGDSEDEEAPKTGLLRKKLTGYEREYWAYVPDQFPKDFRFGVVMWLHPPGSTMQEEMLSVWSSVCRQRGLILLAPLADEGVDWNADDLVFMGDCLGDLEKTYQIDEDLLALHVHEKSTQAGMQFLAINSVKFEGVILLDNVTVLPKINNSPERKLMFLLVSPKSDELSVRFDQQSARRLRDGEIPVETVVDEFEKGPYPDVQVIELMGRWVDSLNRI